MLLPRFRRSSPASLVGPTDEDGYFNVDWTMKALGAERIYAVGDCVNFDLFMATMSFHHSKIARSSLFLPPVSREKVISC